MGSYGRNFDFMVPPHGGQRGGRYVLDADSDPIPNGVPIKATGELDESLTNALTVNLATGAQAPKKGMCGIGLYEAAVAFDQAGFDPVLTTHSDIDKLPPGQLVQCISGDAVKVAFRNTVDRVFLHTRNYPGRVMVAGLGATPTLSPGDMLTPGAGNDTAGYWAETAIAADAWLIIESVDNDRGLVEARLAF